MRVSFLAGTLGRGGAERQLLFMIEALLERNVDVSLLSLTRGEDYEEEVKRLGVDVEWVGQSRNRMRRVFEVARAVSRRSAEIIQSSHFYTNIYAGLAARINGIRGIGGIRSDLNSEVAINGLYSKGQLRIPHHLIANSRVAVERAVSHGISRDRIDYVPNVVRGSDRRAERSDKGKFHTRLSFVGRLSREKRPDLFVELASRLSRELPDYSLEFRIAGDGPLREEVDRLATSAAGAGTRVSLVGQLADPSSLYDETDILVLTSEYEGTPNVVLEAMAHSIPVVASSVGGVPELLDDDRGILVQPNDLEAFVASSKALITDESRRASLGERARVFANSERSPVKLGEQLAEIYETLLAREA